MTRSALQSAAGAGTSTPSVYDGLSRSAASMARGAAERIRAHKRRAVLEVGRELLAVKEKLPHGHFEKWLSIEFSWDVRTARNYMAAAEAFGSKPEMFSALPLSVVYRVAHASEAVKEIVFSRAERGIATDLGLVDQFIREDKGVTLEDDMWRWHWRDRGREDAAKQIVAILRDNHLTFSERVRIANLLEITEKRELQRALRA